MKNLLMAALGGGVGAAAGAILTYSVAAALVDLLPQSGPDSRTGGAFAAFFLAIYGGIAGLIAGVVFSRMAQAGQAAAFWKAAGILTTVVAALVFAGGLAMLAMQDRPPRIAGKTVDLEYELRLPRGHIRPTAAMSQASDHVAFYRPKYYLDYPLNPDTATQEADRWVLRGRFPMDVSPKKMGMSFYMANTAVGHFLLDERRPEPVDLQWFPWVSTSSKTPLDGSFDFRYRYQFRQ